MTPKRETILTALRNWIKQRPGLEFGNYGDVAAYRSEMRSITKDRHHAEYLLAAVERSSITAEGLMAAFRAYSGRLSITPNDDGSVRLDYCTGQYWPTEYRRAACAVLAASLWDYYRDDFASAAKPGESPGSAIRRQFKREFGRNIAARWFN